jgi:membrane protease YdiL (CAAX protease family)
MAATLTDSVQPVGTSRRSVALRALLGTGVMALALGTAGAVGQAASSRFGLAGTLRQALIAVVCVSIAVPLIVLLRRGVDRRPMSGLGLRRPAYVALGVAVTGGSAAAMFALGTAAGWLEWASVDPARLVEFVILNTAIAFVLEALPEELVFRGYVYGTLNRALRRWTAFIATIALFTFAGAGSSVVQSVVGTLLGEDVPGPGFAPPGEDPIAYAVLYPIFGAALLVARITTGSLWTSIGLHLMYLTAVRIAFDGDRRDAGWSAEQATPDALLLVPAFLLLTILLFLGGARLLGRRVGWRERDTTDQPQRALNAVEPERSMASS